jgi:hypothetical protein
LFYVFLLLIGVASIAIYLVFVVREVPGLATQRLGELEPLPPDLGKWKDDVESEHGKLAVSEGLRRETRVLWDEASGRLVYQTRYRDAETNTIVRIEPERAERRRRVKK